MCVFRKEDIITQLKLVGSDPTPPDSLTEGLLSSLTSTAAITGMRSDGKNRMIWRHQSRGKVRRLDSDQTTVVSFLDDFSYSVFSPIAAYDETAGLQLLNFDGLWVSEDQASLG